MLHCCFTVSQCMILITQWLTFSLLFLFLCSAVSYNNRLPISLGSDLLDKVYGLPWEEKCRSIRESSPFGQVDGWRLASFIMKAGEDIRREALVMQVISKMNQWFNTELPESIRPFLRPYTIMCVGGDAGLIECLSDSKSIDEVKKRTDGFESLRDYFERAFGPPSRRRRKGFGPPPPPPMAGEVNFEVAQDNFLRSLVGYSLVCYVLQIKDRHNANILLDRQGHIVHIDFGYVLGDTPKMGKVPLFSERAPFKLSQEFWDVLGGWNVNSGGLGVRGGDCEFGGGISACDYLGCSSGQHDSQWYTPSVAYAWSAWIECPADVHHGAGQYSVDVVGNIHI
jgi:phosphatidylinositol 4-kinase A